MIAMPMAIDKCLMGIGVVCRMKSMTRATRGRMCVMHISKYSSGVAFLTNGLFFSIGHSMIQKKPVIITSSIRAVSNRIMNHLKPRQMLFFYDGSKWSLDFL